MGGVYILMGARGLRSEDSMRSGIIAVVHLLFENDVSD
jgi:hypothetical protein